MGSLGCREGTPAPSPGCGRHIVQQPVGKHGVCCGRSCVPLNSYTDVLIRSFRMGPYLETVSPPDLGGPSPGTVVLIGRGNLDAEEGDVEAPRGQPALCRRERGPGSLRGRPWTAVRGLQKCESAADCGPVAEAQRDAQAALAPPGFRMDRRLRGQAWSSRSQGSSRFNRHVPEAHRVLRLEGASWTLPGAPARQETGQCRLGSVRTRLRVELGEKVGAWVEAPARGSSGLAGLRPLPRRISSGCESSGNRGARPSRGGYGAAFSLPVGIETETCQEEGGGTRGRWRFLALRSLSFRRSEF